MSRVKKDPQLLAAMCARLIAAIDLFGESDTLLSKRLGYANQTTLAKMRMGACFIDVERLAILGQLKIRGGASPNLHWILTGEGEAFIVNGLQTNPKCEAARVLSYLACIAFTDRKI